MIRATILLIVVWLPSGCQAVGDLAVRAPAMVVCTAVNGITGPNHTRQPRSRPSRGTGRGWRYVATHAVPPAPSVNQIAELYARFEYEHCLILAQQIIRHPRASRKDRAVACLYQGAVLFIKGCRREADLSFRNAHQLDPTCRIDPEVFKPTVVACYEHAVCDGGP